MIIEKENILTAYYYKESLLTSQRWDSGCLERSCLCLKSYSFLDARQDKDLPGRWCPVAGGLKPVENKTPCKKLYQFE